ncbi:MAG: hypothetical protein HRU20_00310 [Pseudomonadales bacterium]|nr:hypothetical protein [Pseudomonadales bacterium]
MDGIELHAANGYLIDVFFWANTHQRDEQYGVSQKNCYRFTIEILQAIRSA